MKKSPLSPFMLTCLGLSVASLPVMALPLSGNSLSAHPLSSNPLPGRPVINSLTGGLQDSVDLNVQRNVDESVQQAVERSVEDNIEQAVEDSVQTTVESQTSQAIEESIQQTVTDRVNESVTQGVAEAVEQNAQAGIDDAVDSTLDKALEESVGNDIEQTVTDIASQSAQAGIGEAVDSAVEIDSAVENTLRSGAGVDIGDGTLGQDLQQTLEQASGDGLGGMLPALPPILAVQDRSGATLFHDVEVENQWRAVQREWLVMIDDGDLPQLEALAVDVIEQKRFEQLGMTLVRFRVDAGLDSYQSLQKLLPSAEAWLLERNHIYNYRPQSGEPSMAPTPARREPVCDREVSVGIVDTGVDMGHPAFSGAGVSQRNFLSGAIDAPLSHGTAVAAILVGRAAGLQPALPNASLSVASVMYQREDGSQGATIMDLLGALDWLAERGVSVINLSLAGPPNQLLERAVAALDRRNILLVAAVGNEGPAAPPLYPAAYSPVIGVTAVDRERRVYRWANQGDQVDFAAFGVAVNTAGATGKLLPESGTSMAAPLVSAFAACAQRGESRQMVFESLVSAALDLGEPGRDPVFGHGLLE